MLSLQLATGHRQFQTEMLGSQCPQWQVSSCSVAECVSECVCVCVGGGGGGGGGGGR